MAEFPLFIEQEMNGLPQMHYNQTEEGLMDQVDELEWAGDSAFSCSEYSQALESYRLVVRLYQDNPSLPRGLKYAKNLYNAGKTYNRMEITNS